MISRLRNYFSKYSAGQKVSMTFILLFGGKQLYDYYRFLPDIAEMLKEAPNYTQEQISQIAVANFSLTVTLVAALTFVWFIPVAGSVIGKVVDYVLWTRGREVERYEPKPFYKIPEEEEKDAE
jgi:hypothetical protein